MAETPVSLLERLRVQPSPESWQRLLALYTPLIRDWLRPYFLQGPDIDDLIQEVLTVVARELPRFQHDERTGAFRRWLRTILVNRLRRYWRGARQHSVATGDSQFDNLLDQLEDPKSNLSRRWDEEHDRHVARRLMWLIAPDFEPPTWRAFQLLVLEGKSTAEAAEETGMSINAVRIAKSRVLTRLRQEMAGLVE